MKIDKNHMGNISNGNHSTTQQTQPTVGRVSANAFRRDILNLGNTSSPFQLYSPSAADNGSLRDGVLNAISQTRAGTPSAFFAPAVAAKMRPPKPIDFSSYYTMPPEEVMPILDQLSEEIFNTDFSAMTALQIYEWIENRFIETFGENFMMGSHLMGNIPFDGCLDRAGITKNSNFTYIQIGIRFNSWVCHHIRGSKSAFDVNRERRFGNKNDGEIVNALKAEQSQPLTNRGLAIVAGELYSVGITDMKVSGMGHVVDVLIGSPTTRPAGELMPPWDNMEASWGRHLDSPADRSLSIMFAAHNKLMSDRDNMSNPYILRFRDLLVHFGGRLGSDGLFILDLDDELFNILER